MKIDTVLQMDMTLSVAFEFKNQVHFQLKNMMVGLMADQFSNVAQLLQVTITPPCLAAILKAVSRLPHVVVSSSTAVEPYQIIQRGCICCKNTTKHGNVANLMLAIMRNQLSMAMAPALVAIKLKVTIKWSQCFNKDSAWALLEPGRRNP